MHIDINGRLVGPGEPVYMIAEACENHLGSTDAAVEMARLAKLAGADAVKYQHHLPDEEMLPDCPMSDNFDIPLYDFLKKHSLSIEQHKVLKRFCEDIDITYLCTPFCFKAAIELDGMGVSAFKIGSGELSDLPSLTGIAKLNRPMILSTGMSTFEEIDRTHTLLTNLRASFSLLNCVSEYPPDYADLNLRVINRMQQRYPKTIIGHSDHSPDIYTSLAAVTLGAKIIEKHVTTSHEVLGPDRSVSITFDDFGNMVDGVRKIESAMGDRKLIHQRELEIRRWAHRSVVTTSDVKAGQLITEGMVWTKRPGTGIPAHLLPTVIGRSVRNDIPANCLVSWDDLVD